MPRRRAPLWFELVVAVGFVCAYRVLDPSNGWGGTHGDGELRPQQAFWPLVILIASAIWKGLEVAGRVTLEVLKWSVIQLWAFAKTVYSATLAVGKDLIKGLRRGWDFLEATYDKVLKPAWQHFWKWFDRARRWLEDVFKPVFRWLYRVRKWILDFYAKYVRPILDILGIAQKVLRVLETLGLDWAKRLDAQLAELQRRIDEPFRYLLAQVNKIINVVNRVVTADGLFQRLALIRSIERDFKLVANTWWWAVNEAPTDDQRRRLRSPVETKSLREHTKELRSVLRDEPSPMTNAVQEHVQDLRLKLRAA